MFGKTDIAVIFSSALMGSFRIFCRHESHRPSFTRGILAIKSSSAASASRQAFFLDMAVDFEIVGVYASPLERKVDRRMEIL